MKIGNHFILFFCYTAFAIKGVFASSTDNIYGDNFKFSGKAFCDYVVGKYRDYMIRSGSCPQLSNPKQDVKTICYYKGNVSIKDYRFLILSKFTEVTHF